MYDFDKKKNIFQILSTWGVVVNRKGKLYELVPNYPRLSLRCPTWPGFGNFLNSNGWRRPN